jgi:hypothetical protein
VQQSKLVPLYPSESKLSNQRWSDTETVGCTQLVDGWQLESFTAESRAHKAYLCTMALSQYKPFPINCRSPILKNQQLIDSPEDGTAITLLRLAAPGTVFEQLTVFTLACSACVIV